MEQLISKVRRAISLGLALLKGSQQQKTINQIVNLWLAAAVIFLLAAEEHARRVWRDRASSAQIGLARATLEISALRLAASQAKALK